MSKRGGNGGAFPSLQKWDPPWSAQDPQGLKILFSGNRLEVRPLSPVASESLKTAAVAPVAQWRVPSCSTVTILLLSGGDVATPGSEGSSPGPA